MSEITLPDFAPFQEPFPESIAPEMCNARLVHSQFIREQKKIDLKEIRILDELFADSPPDSYLNAYPSMHIFKCECEYDCRDTVHYSTCVERLWIKSRSRLFREFRELRFARIRTYYERKARRIFLSKMELGICLWQKRKSREKRDAHEKILERAEKSGCLLDYL